MREHAPKFNPKTILRSSSNSSKFEDDEFTAFAENNSKISNAKERAIFPNGMEKYNWHWAARQMPKTLLTREEIQELKRWIKLKKHYQGWETNSGVLINGVKISYNF